jgi:hypothetical protein
LAIGWAFGAMYLAVVFGMGFSNEPWAPIGGLMSSFIPTLAAMFILKG